MKRYTDQELQKIADKDPEKADALMDKMGYIGKTSSRTQSRYIPDDRTGGMTGAPAPKFKTGMPTPKISDTVKKTLAVVFKTKKK